MEKESYFIQMEASILAIFGREFPVDKGDLLVHRVGIIKEHS
jgi:hypothetical protein